jgi:cysteine-rich repeat protein
VTCGNGSVEVGEACDNGDLNGTPSNACDSSCRFACGNGLADSGEQCDDGNNNGSYGTCNPNCTLAPYCGDDDLVGVESCDNGGSNVSTTAYGSGLCTTQCTPAPYCGDGRIDAVFGEECDSSSVCSNTCKFLR